MAKMILRRGRKIGDPNYSSTDVGLEIEIEYDAEIYYDNAEKFQAFIASNYSFLDGLLEAEIKRIYASRPKPVETARERGYAGAPNGNGHNGNGDRAIDEARTREEPRQYRNGDGASSGYTKQPVDWGRGGSQPSGGQYRSGGGGGKSYGPPKSGGGLIAWARDLEEKGEAKGLSKWIMYQWGKRHGLGDAKVVDWPPQAVQDCYEEARSRQENGN